ncbi:YnfA family protein [Ottowia sp. GY511]|uniref:YnfA family protein n=1 Tax=Ottowia flava TaxID=2675430 RepID=A0ABW4KQD4_9BURK|nr:YnfA family protein [Ottowia sp. GY511]TXK29832.1 YnfA family protein [Ottowia sp. GY511]
MALLKIFALFVVTALAEIVGCYLPYLWVRQGKSVWLLVPAAASLALFAWLLTLHPQAAGRVYAAYGGVYVTVALAWLWAVDAVRPTTTDWFGVGLCLLGMVVIMGGARTP